MHSRAQTAQQVEQGQRATRPSATLTSAFPVVASPASHIASSATPPGDDRRDNTALVHSAQNVAPSIPSGSELLSLTEILIDRANVNLDDPRHRISIMTLQNAVNRQDEEVRRLRADIQRRAWEYDALKLASEAIPEREVELENRAETLDLENRQLRWANRQLQQLGPFVERQNMQIEQKSWHIQEQDENRKEIEEDNEKLEKEIEDLQGQVEDLEGQVEDLKKRLEEEKVGRQKDKENYTQQLPKFKQSTHPTDMPNINTFHPRSRIFESSVSPQPTTQATPVTASRSERDAALPDRRRSLMARAAEYTTTPPTRPSSVVPRLPDRRYARDRSMSPLRSPPQRDFREARAPSPPPVSRRRFLTETIRHRPEDAIANPNRDSPSVTLSRHPRRIAPSLNDDTFAVTARLGNHTVESHARGQQPLSRHNHLTRNDERGSSNRELQCAGCYMRGIPCDGGLPCNNCKSGKCRYRPCYSYSKGWGCSSEHCTMVHDETDHL
ncbi:hypothetical protein DBV05_g7515 [Lasiodiplodia theobromae]|uniref:Uncharacterized protein n=1 Tax=Lasiodiplodia theobromae TaxID=45133 RepID=A0A5N5D7W1_9PEZI|nr:hypothetical protein DBV05_g7515 [Lasiodiplodia theobromae]